MFNRCRGTLGVDSLKYSLLLSLHLRLLVVVVQGTHGAEPRRTDNLVFYPLVKGFRSEQSKQPFEKQQNRQNSVSRDTVMESCLFSLFETGSHFVTQAGLELVILSPQHPARWDSTPVPPRLAHYHVFFTLGGSSC